MSISEQDLPALYRAADDASVAAQRRYLRVFAADLICLVAAALVLSWAPPSERIAQVTYGLGAVFLAISLVFTIILSQARYTRKWYGGRAVAESVKSLAWRYMTRSEPFHNQESESNADALFVGMLRDILSQGDQLGVSLSGHLVRDRQITDRMRFLRSAPLSNRMDAYRNDRLEDQQRWYSHKSSRNERSGDVVFGSVMLLQLAALVAAIVLAAGARVIQFNPVGVLTAAAAAAFAWLQVKQHQELTQSYSVAATELGLIREQLSHVESEEDFGNFVGDSETAISREHTLWLARRDNVRLGAT